MHDTEGAEAAHKTSMRLAANRVRHLQVNKTQSNMQDYLCNHALFEALKETTAPFNLPTRPAVLHAGVHRPLQERIRGMTGVYTVEMGENLAAPDSQKRFLHREARVARVELMELVCGKLGLSNTRRSYRALGELRWTFGQVV